MAMTKDQLFVQLANFLKHNCGIVADFRDSNTPWTLREQLEQFEEEQRTKSKRRRRVVKHG